jgi:hypothetical protein
MTYYAAKFYGCTENRGARIKLINLRTDTTVLIPFDFEYNCIEDQLRAMFQVKWLFDHGEYGYFTDLI